MNLLGKRKNGLVLDTTSPLTQRLDSVWCEHAQGDLGVPKLWGRWTKFPKVLPEERERWEERWLSRGKCHCLDPSCHWLPHRPGDGLGLNLPVEYALVWMGFKDCWHETTTFLGSTFFHILTVLYPHPSSFLLTTLLICVQFQLSFSCCLSLSSIKCNSQCNPVMLTPWILELHSLSHSSCEYLLRSSFIPEWHPGNFNLALAVLTGPWQMLAILFSCSLGLSILPLQMMLQL